MTFDFFLYCWGGGGIIRHPATLPFPSFGINFFIIIIIIIISLLLDLVFCSHSSTVCKRMVVGRGFKLAKSSVVQ